MHVYIDTRIYEHIYIYIYLYMYTYINTQTHPHPHEGQPSILYWSVHVYISFNYSLL